MTNGQEATEELIAFWRRCPLNGDQPQRYCHPDDEDFFRRYRKLVDSGGLDFHGYVNSNRFGDFKDSVFHLSLIPIPYIGDLRKADIVILTLNPSVDYAAYWFQTYSSDYRRAIRANLIQEFDDITYPFIGLDPQFSEYWENRKSLRSVISVIAKSNEWSYRTALKSLASRLAVLELVPYFSWKFEKPSFLLELPSVRMITRYVTETIKPAAQEDKKVLIVTRQIASWGMAPKDDDSRSVIVYTKHEPRAALLGANSRGGKAILRRYGIASP